MTRRGPRPGAKALVTGGGGAIAREVAGRLARVGYRLVLLDRNGEAMAATAAALPGGAETEVVDLGTAEGIRAACAVVEERHGDVDLLVNTAGVVEPGDVVDLDPVWLDLHINVNLLAAMQLTRSAARLMRPRGRGDVVTIISMGAIAPMPGSAAYAASKAGLRGFQISLRAELAPLGIRVMGVLPSGVDTPMLRNEALNGGTALNFLSEPLTAGQVADAVLRALRTGRLETYLPYSDSLTSRAVLSIPWLAQPLLPRLEWFGERGRRKYLRDRGLVGGQEPGGAD